MKTNKLPKLLVLSVLGVFALTACDEIIAKPTKYEEPLISTPSSFSEEVYNNIASVVYDSIHDNGIGSEVLNQILYLYAVDTFGPYNANVVVNNSKVGDSQITLAQFAHEGYDSAKLEAFVQGHKAYWDSTRTDASAPASESEKKRVEAKAKTVEDRIAEEMYNKISSGSYTDRHEFDEAKFLKGLRASLESVANPSEVEPYGPVQILPAVEPKDVFREDIGYLHREFYDSENYTYVVDDVVPGIYTQLLAEQYLLDETYNTLGRSYAREVNIVKFTTNDKYPDVANALAKKLVKEINEDPAVYALPESPITKYGLLERFKQYSNAEIGVVGELGIESQILTGAATLGTISTGDASLDAKLTAEIGTFFLGTSYGELAEKYVKLNDLNHYGVTAEYEDTFTNNGAYPRYVGLEEQRKGLEEGDNTYNGWFVKNGGLTELPDSVRSRLFNIGVATGIKDSALEKADPKNNRSYVEGEWKEAENENAYVCRINGHYYLKTGSRVKGESIENDILHYDADSKTYYIIEIEQAVSSSKLSKTSERNYAHTISEEKMQEIINEVAKIIGKGESYSTLATKKYLKAMSIEYHDDSVYDYFKTNYPELFDSDAEATTTSEE